MAKKGSSRSKTSLPQAAASSSKKAQKKAHKKKAKAKKAKKKASSRALPSVLSCGVLVVQRPPHGRPVVLALLRADGSPDLPKGHVKPGERDKDAALRELFEEAGIAPERVRFDDAFSFESRYRTRNKKTRLPVMKTVRLFLGYVTAPVVVSLSDHGDYAWLPLEDDEHLERELHDNPTFLGAARALLQHWQTPTTLVSRATKARASH